jgi:hypothetical protein
MYIFYCYVNALIRVSYDLKERLRSNIIQNIYSHSFYIIQHIHGYSIPSFAFTNNTDITTPDNSNILNSSLPEMMHPNYPSKQTNIMYSLFMLEVNQSTKGYKIK